MLLLPAVEFELVFPSDMESEFSVSGRLNSGMLDNKSQDCCLEDKNGARGYPSMLEDNLAWENVVLP